MNSDSNNRWITLVLTEPYRLFFPLAWLGGLIGVSYWLLVGTKLIVGYAAVYHGLIQIELFGAGFAIGFLLTALPKFLRAPAATPIELSSISLLFGALAVCLIANLVEVSQVCFVILLLLVIGFAADRFTRRKADPPYSFALVAFGLVEGVLGAALIVFPSATFPLLGQKLVEQGMLLSLSLGVGSFLGPRLMGVVDVINAVVSLPNRASADAPWYRSPVVAVIFVGVTLLLSFLIECGVDRGFGVLLRAITASLCLARFGVLKAPRSQSVVGLFVAVALWMMLLGLWIAAFLPQHEIGALHLTFVGGFALLILAIGAQVTTSHGAIANFWKIRRSWCVATFVLVLAAAIARAVAMFFPGSYLEILAIAAGLLDLALLLWGFGVLRYVNSHSQQKNAFREDRAH